MNFHNHNIRELLTFFNINSFVLTSLAEEIHSIVGITKNKHYTYIGALEIFNL